MKKKSWFLLLMLLVLTGLSACTDDEQPLTNSREANYHKPLEIRVVWITGLCI
jgi:hypothetical protein